RRNPERCKRRFKQVRRRVNTLNVVTRDNRVKAVEQPDPAQMALHPGQRRTRRHGQLQAARPRLLDVRLDARQYRLRVDERQPPGMCAPFYLGAVEVQPCQLHQMLKRHEPGLFQARADDVVVAVKRQFTPVLAVDVTPDIVVRFLSIEDQSVKVKDEGANHTLPSLRFSSCRRTCKQYTFTCNPTTITTLPQGLREC